MIVALAVTIAAIGVLVWLQREPNDPIVDMADLAKSVTTVTTSSLEAGSDTVSDAEDFPAIEDSAIRDADERAAPVPGTYEVVESIMHDSEAFTQGLEFDGDALYESTGLIGESTLRELDPETGTTIRSIDLPGDVFGEGLTIVGDEIIQITWQSGIAYRWDVDTLEPLGTFSYDGEGWGICDDGSRLVMSNGSSDLTMRDIDTFSTIETVAVTFNGAPVERLNELECVDDRVWANIWKTPLVIEIDPESGEVLTVIDASALRPTSTADDDLAVLNGIAYDADTDTFLLSGKLWPTTYRVRLGGTG